MNPSLKIMSLHPHEKREKNKARIQLRQKIRIKLLTQARDANPGQNNVLSHRLPTRLPILASLEAAFLVSA